MEKIRVRRQGKKYVYIHNDLSNAAHHHKTTIEKKLESDDRAGIAYDYMACLVMLAFSLESIINFLGYKIVNKWDERQKYQRKLEVVLKTLQVVPDWNNRPYSSLSQLKEFRDLVAHGKPNEFEHDEVLIATHKELDVFSGLNGEWEKFCTHDTVFNAYSDVDQIWSELLERSGLKIYDTLTRGEHSISVIEKIADKTS